MAELTEGVVKLKSKVKGTKAKARTQSFQVKQANDLLSLKFSSWILDDDKYKWNGTELAKSTKS